VSAGAALLVGLASALALVSLVWLGSLRARDASLIDRWWGLGFALLAWVYLVAMRPAGPRGPLLAVLVSIWGLRLGWHITRRNRGHGEDPRYAAMRAASPRTFPWSSLVTVFWLQAALMWVVGLPLHAAMRPDSPGQLGLLDLAGIGSWLVGFAFEAIGDAQLAAFRSDPANRGRVMDRGLWAWTRHPNYFGDATLWWGFGLFALSTPGAWWTLVGPLVMSVLLVRVSGAALLERHLSARPGYLEYVRRTSAFLPWPPRRT
jgi:steroid 5-alpha reductase family enzyme